MVHYNKTTPWEALHKLLRLTSQLIGKTKETSQVRDSIFTNSLFTWAHSQKAINGRVSQCISAAERTELHLARGEKKRWRQAPQLIIIAVAITMTTEPEQIMQKGNAKVLDEIMLSDYDKTNTQRRSHTGYVYMYVYVYLQLCLYAHIHMYVYVALQNSLPS